ncbi:MAG: hypothetical protein WCR31_09430 [Treponema sp.]
MEIAKYLKTMHSFFRESTVASVPFYDKKNQEYIMKSVCELREGKGTAHELIEDFDERADLVLQRTLQ